MGLRPMVPEDLDNVMVLETMHQHKPWQKSGFEQALRLGHRCMVVEQNGAVIGYGVADKGHGRTICAPDNPRAALMLYDDWFKHGVESKAEVLYAEVQADNVRAISLLMRFGFAKIGERPSYYGPGLAAQVWARPTGLGLLAEPDRTAQSAT